MQANLLVMLIPLVAVAGAGAGAAPPATQPTTLPAVVRKPQWPLKDKRTLFRDDAIAQARANVEKYSSAKALADSLIKIADEWAAWDDAELCALIAPASVPRAFDVSAVGCPKCGNQIMEKFGLYAWIVDPAKPFKIECPVDGTVFPTNDFETYYRSGFTKKVGWDTEYVDDGWGWTDPKTGERYWFVAYANHWTIFGKIKIVVNTLGRAYVLTGDKRYAHKALVALHRFAEVYPAMDHANQSRYGSMMKALGRDYRGKIVNHIWETDMASSLAEAYDACWDAIDGDAELQRFTGKSGPEIRAFIEANLLEDAIDAYFAGKIRGNFGMHQQTLTLLAIVRQNGDRDHWLDSLMNDAGSNPHLLGLNYALYNLIYRDGIPSETSVHYNSIWLERISLYAPLLEKAGLRPFDNPKLKRMYDGALAMICARAHNPNIGDGGVVWGGITRPDVPTYQVGYRKYHDPRCGAYLQAYGATGDDSFKTFESLFYPPVEPPPPTTAPTTAPTKLPPLPSRLLDGYGMAFLNNAADSVGIALYYGLKAGHGHFDRLNIELFANGHPMLPDLGYPDAMNEFVPGIFTWSKNTISHNTVTVDAARQSGNVPGTVELFADGSFARAIDVSANGTYPQCQQYRRAMIMVDCGDDRSYFVDVFTVRGGRQHDYSLHGPPGSFEVVGGQWSAQARGTLAGEDVEVGQIYDDAKLGAPGYTGGFGAYAGSGFQHLYNVRWHQDGEFVATWAHEKDPTAKVHVRVLPQPGQQLILANARVSPAKYPQVLTYLIDRRTGENVASRFVSVIESFRGEPVITSVRAVQLSSESGTGLEVQRGDGGRDLILYDETGSEKNVGDGGVSSDAHVAVVRRDGSGRVVGRYFAGGSFLAADGQRLEGHARRGAVVSVDPNKLQVRVKPDPADAGPEPFVGRVVRFHNELRKTSHTVTKAARDGDEIVLTVADDLLVGRARVDAAGADAITTKTAMPLAAIYRGVMLANAAFEPITVVKEVQNGTIVPTAPIPERKHPAPGEDVWLINVGAGDTFELPAVLDVAPQ